MVFFGFACVLHRYSDTASTTAPYMEHYVRLKSYVNDTSTGQVRTGAQTLAWSHRTA